MGPRRLSIKAAEWKHFLLKKEGEKKPSLPINHSAHWPPKQFTEARLYFPYINLDPWKVQWDEKTRQNTKGSIFGCHESALLPISWESNHISRESYRKYLIISLQSWGLVMMIHTLLYYLRRKGVTARTDDTWQVRAGFAAPWEKPFWFQRAWVCPVVLGVTTVKWRKIFCCFVLFPGSISVRQVLMPISGRSRMWQIKSQRLKWNIIMMLLLYLSVISHPLLWTARKAASSEPCTMYCPFDTAALSFMFTPFRYF